MVIIRPFNCYGEYMRSDSYGAVMPNFFKRISRGQPPIINGTGMQTRDFSYVSDTCDGIMLADQNKNVIGETFNIGQGKEVNINKIAKTMLKKYSEITGKKMKLECEFHKPRKGDVMRHLASISKARKILGYKPKISLEEGITRYINWELRKSNSRIKK